MLYADRNILYIYADSQSEYKHWDNPHQQPANNRTIFWNPTDLNHQRINRQRHGFHRDAEGKNICHTKLCARDKHYHQNRHREILLYRANVARAN